MIKVIILVSVYIATCIGNMNFSQVLEVFFQKGLDSMYIASPDAVGIGVYVIAPNQQISWTGVSGFSEKSKNKKLTGDQPVLIASNTKTYVAAMILKLLKMRRLQLEQTLYDLISNASCEQLQSANYEV